jgi:hypothetical protein
VTLPRRLLSIFAFGFSTALPRSVLRSGTWELKGMGHRGTHDACEQRGFPFGPDSPSPRLYNSTARLDPGQ